MNRPQCGRSNGYGRFKTLMMLKKKHCPFPREASATLHFHGAITLHAPSVSYSACPLVCVQREEEGSISIVYVITCESPVVSYSVLLLLVLYFMSHY